MVVVLDHMPSVHGPMMTLLTQPVCPLNVPPVAVDTAPAVVIVFSTGVTTPPDSVSSTDTMTGVPSTFCGLAKRENSELPFASKANKARVKVLAGLL